MCRKQPKSEEWEERMGNSPSLRLRYPSRLEPMMRIKWSMRVSL